MLGFVRLCVKESLKQSNLGQVKCECATTLLCSPKRTSCYEVNKRKMNGWWLIVDSWFVRDVVDQAAFSPSLLRRLTGSSPQPLCCLGAGLDGIPPCPRIYAHCCPTFTLDSTRLDSSLLLPLVQFTIDSLLYCPIIFMSLV